MATLLTARWVLPVAGSTIENGAVLVEGSKIKKVGARKDLEKAKDQEETLDLGDAVLMPGFIDAHTHFESAVFRGVCDDLSFAKWKIQVSKKEAALDEDDFAVSARLGAIEAIRSGITCVGDTCRTEASFKVLKDAGLRGTIFYEFSGMDPATTDEVLKEGADKVASWRKSLDKSLIDVGFSPHSCYTVSPPLFRAISERAQEEDLPLSFHLAGSKDE
ncbi:MAG: amidohydrolase family protein [Terriglobia bacterium]